MKPPRDGKVVYSTDPDFARRCPECGELPERCACGEAAEAPASAQTATVSRERRAGGTVVTLVRGLRAGLALEALGKELRARCGAGGTVKDGTIEIQGDHRDKVAADLAKRGYKVKRSGG